jgi:hypothetical protein
MGTTEFADHVAEEVVEAGVVDRPAPVKWVGTMKAKQEKPYLPLHTLEGWSATLEVLANRIRTDNGRIGYYLSNAAEWVQMAVWEYDRNYGGHANGPAPTNGGD